ncbi:hypothetical protein KDA_42340 [Dictyobacter alpinus]|uniref:DUF3592 domain-containing protein n=1 Tax=Dictyobacter alpinus TaxID=2014873 RepID=A0A402BBT0_9CHLR|nr:DUF3592 domain-containing protein [Dictyobacter alpinus]GCE28750.1 hypothetical protein KDA_42340 [Dictyobacter alpinus]
MIDFLKEQWAHILVVLIMFGIATFLLYTTIDLWNFHQGLQNPGATDTIKGKVIQADFVTSADSSECKTVVRFHTRATEQGYNIYFNDTAADEATCQQYRGKELNVTYRRDNPYNAEVITPRSDLSNFYFPLIMGIVGFVFTSLWGGTELFIILKDVINDFRYRP